MKTECEFCEKYSTTMQQAIDQITHYRQLSEKYESEIRKWSRMVKKVSIEADKMLEGTK